MSTTDEVLTAYWLRYYINENGLCAICGNKGVIDTYSAKPRKVPEHTFCICPNGRALREAHEEETP